MAPNCQWEFTDWKIQSSVCRLYSPWHPFNTRHSGHIWTLEVSSLGFLILPPWVFQSYSWISSLASFPSSICPHVWTQFSFLPHLALTGLLLFFLSSTHALPDLSSVWIVFLPTDSSSLRFQLLVQFFREDILSSWCLDSLPHLAWADFLFPAAGGQPLRGETFGLSPRASPLLENITILKDFYSDDSKTYFSGFDLSLRHQSTFLKVS